MTKKQYFKVIFSTVLISFFLYLFFGRWVAAKISTWPLLNKFNVLSPQTPIVITNRQEVRVSDSTDAVQAANTVKSKLSAVVLTGKGGISVAGDAVNITSDGTFVTAEGVLPQDLANCAVVLNDGRQAKISASTVDLATGLVFFKAGINNVPTASLGDSSALNPGEKILFAANNTSAFSTHLFLTTVSAEQGDTESRVFNSDFPSRSFGAQSAGNMPAGAAVANMNGEVVGLWTGQNIVSSDVLKQSVNLYLADNQSIARPYFGFSYSVISKTDAELLNLPAGARVTDISRPTAAISAVPAAQAGLEIGDVIISVNGEQISDSQQPEVLLQNFKPGDNIIFYVTRGQNPLQIKLQVGELK